MRAVPLWTALGLRSGSGSERAEKLKIQIAKVQIADHQVARKADHHHVAGKGQAEKTTIREGRQ